MPHNFATFNNNNEEIISRRKWTTLEKQLIGFVTLWLAKTAFVTIPENKCIFFSQEKKNSLGSGAISRGSISSFWCLEFFLS